MVKAVWIPRDREVACSASDRHGSNFESCVWRAVSSHPRSSHHLQEVHKDGLNPHSFHFIFTILQCIINIYHTAMCSRKAVIANFKSEQLLPLAIERQWYNYEYFVTHILLSDIGGRYTRHGSPRVIVTPRIRERRHLLHQTWTITSCLYTATWNSADTTNTLILCWLNVVPPSRTVAQH